MRLCLNRKIQKQQIKREKTLKAISNSQTPKNVQKWNKPTKYSIENSNLRIEHFDRDFGGGVDGRQVGQHCVST